MNKFDIDTENKAYDFDITYSFNKASLPDTNLNPFNELIKAPDLKSWGEWKSSGAPEVYGWMADFIARSVTGKSFTEDHLAEQRALTSGPTDSYVSFVGYAPLQSVPYEDISPSAIQ